MHFFQALLVNSKLAYSASLLLSYQLTVTERTELLIEGGVSPLGDGEEGADDESFNFLFEGGMTLP